MKTALYMEDGILQLVITPETEFETKTVDMFSNKHADVTFKKGQFYACQGGYIRHNDYPTHSSLFIVARTEHETSER